MSETSSDAESSCGWSIISYEGSDIETLETEAANEIGAKPSVSAAVENPELSESQTYFEEQTAASFDDTLDEQTGDETLCSAETREPENNAEDSESGKEPVLSSSDISDIVTLGDMKEDERTEEEAAVGGDCYLGTSCSSQYTFKSVPAENVFSAQQQEDINSSSSEDEAEPRTSSATRRRRVRKNTAEEMEPDEGEDGNLLESWTAEEREFEQEGEVEEEPEDDQTAALNDGPQGGNSRTFNKYILMVFIIAIGIGVGPFYGSDQTQERQKSSDKVHENELDSLRDLIQRHERDQSFTNQRIGFDDIGLNQKQVISLLKEVIEKIKRENHDLIKRNMQMQAQSDAHESLLKQATEQKTSLLSQQQSSAAENQQLKISLEYGEKSLFLLQEELAGLRSQIKNLEMMGAGTESLRSENSRLKTQLETEKQLVGDFHVQREYMEAEMHTLRRKLDKERRMTEELRREVNHLTSVFAAEREAGTGAEELQTRLMELEEKLSYEQQRSDLWERLYVETKEERAKGDTEPKVRKKRAGVSGRVKETFDAVKNSTKEFVYHHKEQIKKAKEAVKENLRKFSDSVKSTFRHFKNSASTFLDKARCFYKKNDKKSKEDSWEHNYNFKPKYDSFHNDHNTRKSMRKEQEAQTSSSHKASVKGCTGVFDCAYWESKNFFNKAMEPIRADEFSQLLRSYLQQEVDHFHHWEELDTFISSYFHNGVFIHDRMLFTDFVSGVEDYLMDMQEHYGLDYNVFGDLDDFIYRHFFGDMYTKTTGPNGRFEKSNTDSREKMEARQQRKDHKIRSRPQRERKYRRTGRSADPHLAEVKIELGPMPFDPKY